MGGWIVGFSIFLITMWSGLYRRIAAVDEELEQESTPDGSRD